MSLPVEDPVNHELYTEIPPVVSIYNGVRYSKQCDHHMYCCQVIAVLNALRYFGVNATGASGALWAKYTECTGCEIADPTPKAMRLFAESLGLEVEYVPLLPRAELVAKIPVVIPVTNKHSKTHWALLIDDIDEHTAVLANYRGTLGASSADFVPWEHVEKNYSKTNNRGYSLRLVNDDLASSTVVQR